MKGTPVYLKALAADHQKTYIGVTAAFAPGEILQRVQDSKLVVKRLFLLGVIAIALYRAVERNATITINTSTATDSKISNGVISLGWNSTSGSIFSLSLRLAGDSGHFILTHNDIHRPGRTVKATKRGLDGEGMCNCPSGRIKSQNAATPRGTRVRFL